MNFFNLYSDINNHLLYLQTKTENYQYIPRSSADQKKQALNIELNMKISFAF